MNIRKVIATAMLFSALIVLHLPAAAADEEQREYVLGGDLIGICEPLPEDQCVGGVAFVDLRPGTWRVVVSDEIVAPVGGAFRLCYNQSCEDAVQPFCETVEITMTSEFTLNVFVAGPILGLLRLSDHGCDEISMGIKGTITATRVAD